MASQAALRNRVLVIDDDPVLRELLCALLEAEDYTSESADSGEQGLAKLREGFAAGVVLADIQLPGLSGAGLAAELRKAVPSACLLCMSGSEAPAETRTAYDGFLLKPFSTEDFATAVQFASAREGQPEMRKAASSSTQNLPEPLDADIYERLAKSLPPAQLAELYELSLDDIGLRIATMRENLAAEDHDAYRREAHALKGGCGMVGALELAGLAARAEAGSSGDTPAIEEFTAAATRLRSIMAARSTVPNEPQ